MKKQNDSVVTAVWTKSRKRKSMNNEHDPSIAITIKMRN